MFRAWVDRTTTRRGVAAGERIGGRQIFILPTRFGLLAALAVAALFLVALNYQNSMVFLLAFLLAALGVVAMVTCHRQIRGVEIRRIEAPPVFAEQPGRLVIDIRNAGRQPRDGLHAYTATSQGRPSSVGPNATCRLTAPLAPRRRGRYTVAGTGLACTTPFGTFRAWSRLRQPLEYIVYPQPAIGVPNPADAGAVPWQGRRSTTEPEDFSGLTRYRAGDRPAQIAWRAYAQGGRMLRKTFDARQGGTPRWLEFEAAPGNDTEQRLATLCGWVVSASRSGSTWGLRLPAHTIGPGHGHAHLHRCLRALALYPGPYDGC